MVRYVCHYAPRYVPDRVLHYAAYPARGRALRRAAPRLLNHALVRCGAPLSDTGDAAHRLTSSLAWRPLERLSRRVSKRTR